MLTDDIRRTKKITQKMLREIDNRRLQALRMGDYNEIMDAKQQVLSIIDKDGLQNDEAKIRLDSAFKTLPYIMPLKKAIDVQITTRKLEDIIEETIQEAEIITEEKQDNKADDSDKVQIQAKNKENDVR